MSVLESSALLVLCSGGAMTLVPERSLLPLPVSTLIAHPAAACPPTGYEPLQSPVFERHTIVTTARLLPFPPELVLQIVQSPSQLIRLNPLVVDCRLVPPPPTAPSSSTATAEGGQAAAAEEEEREEEWEIQDRTHLLGLPVSWSYTATFLPTPSGVLVRPRAGAGVRLENVWTVLPAEPPVGEAREGKLNGWSSVQERAEIWAPLGLMGWVRGTLQKAHEGLMDALEKRLEELAGKVREGS
ncbi:hypothetical protein CALVIDRAFT_553423 [Calocera viscosa TUFC12733]|uniref:DUF7053 domain-containing protein n=1 Tax=Calocera viscosa (strain TUFC12733) TaxID=1330018 RepID=A0A167PP93_CALVF|nr:hypothetical protein CALVIDRAFT_553423 [Calocera viscosa TUFC12733]